MRVEGLALQSNATGLHDFLQAMFSQACSRLVVDLTDCLGMDSTFIGVLAFTVNYFGDDDKHVVLLNLDPRSEKTLKKVGLLPRVAVGNGEFKLPEVTFSPIPDVHLPSDDRERLVEVKNLHEELVKLNENNRIQFGEFIDAINEALRDGA